MTPLRRWMLALAALLPLGGHAQIDDEKDNPPVTPPANTPAAQQPWDEYAKHIQSRNAVAALGPDLFGEQVNLYNGGLSFAATDVSIPGNSGLPFALARSYGVSARSNNAYNGRPFGDWELDVPRLEGVYGLLPEDTVAWPTNRCTDLDGPPDITTDTGSALRVATTFPAHDYWQGVTAHMPGGGELLVADATLGTPRPSGGGDYQWMTSAFTYFKCVLGGASDGGEAFEAITADGTKYTFDRMAQFWEPQLERPNNFTGDEAVPLQRRRSVLYASRVEDRFGHWVEYEYEQAVAASPLPPQLLRLKRIRAGYKQPSKTGPATDEPDHRNIELTYKSGTNLIHQASVGNRTWTYHYDDLAHGQAFASLTQVTLPDQSAWQIQLRPLTTAVLQYGVDVARSCDHPGTATGVQSSAGFAQSVTGSITHPAGARGDFELAPRQHGRSNVPKLCYGDPGEDVSHYVQSYEALSLVRKQVSGPAQVSHQWTYAYESVGSFGAVCTDPNGCAPSCLSDACATSRARTTVQSPGEWQRFSFGHSYRYDEGKLRRVERGNSQYDILQTDDTGYELAQSGLPFAAPVGRSLRHRGDGFDAAYLRPRKAHTITRHTGSALVCDGTTPIGGNSCFHWQASQFDNFARPVLATHASSLGFSRTEQMAYEDNAAAWVVGQPKWVYEQSTGKYTQWTVYDSVTALPIEKYAFGPPGTGKLVERRTYHSIGDQRGLVEYLYDGSNIKRTQLLNYYRGLPTKVIYHDNNKQEAVVDQYGDITRLTDAANASTDYGHDAMGRITSITPPAADSVAWTPTSIGFTNATPAQFGLPAGHWQRSVFTGNQRSVTYYDGQWRPVLTHEYEYDPTTGTSIASTQRMVRRAYDHQGRETFVSYPQRSIAAYNSAAAGSYTLYDALGRVTARQADSEHGLLNTTYQYLSGFRTQVTNPRGYSSTMWYQAYSEPSDQFPVRIDSPEGVSTLVSRNVYGNPQSMTRNATWSGLPITLSRHYVHDAFQRLCKTIEPESGAEIVDYDASGNVAWKAPGQGLTGTAACDREYVAAGAKISQAYDDRNRPTVTSFGDGSPSIVRGWTPDGLPHTVATWTSGGPPPAVGSSISTWTYAYNQRRLLEKETLVLSGINPNGTLANVPAGESFLQVHYQYNALGHLSAWKYPGSGGYLVLNPNALGEARQTGAYATELSYHPNGTLAGLRYGNNVLRSVTLNARQLPWQVSESGVMHDVYSYDRNGNITEINDLHSADNFNTGRNFGYDGRDRLTSITYRNSPGGVQYPNLTFTYPYDGLDNLRGYRSPAGTPYRNMDYEYNPTTWRLTRITNPDGGADYANYLYDNRGNAISRGAWGNQVFDLGNRMRSMSGQGVAASYDYDGHGRRTLISEPGVPRRLQMYHQGGLLLAEIAIDGSDTVTELQSYFYNGRNPIAERLRTPGSDVTNYVHADHLGSPMARSSGFGSVYERTLFEPYGLKATSAFNPPYGIGLFPDGLGFAGHRTDRVSGLSYMQQRYYDPVAGRFISMDPVTADSGNLFNRYAYANNNPVTLIDSDGRQAVETLTAFAVADLATPEPTDVAAIPKVIGYIILIGATAVTVEIADWVFSDNGGGAEGTSENGPVNDPHAPGDAPDATKIVRGGTGDRPTPGTQYSAGQGSTTEEAGRGVPHGKIRETTAGEIRSNGGTVEVKPELSSKGNLNPLHVNVIEGGKESTLGELKDNPAPKGDRY